MDEEDMAEAITYVLNQKTWKAEVELFNTIAFENENGEKFIITVEKVEEQ